jgi:act minimal PKS acyl carrier protein
MRKFTVTDLARILRAAAGEDEALDLDAKILELSFADLGYDSLAVMETSSRVEQEFGVLLPEEEMSDIETPVQFISFVNEQLSAKALTATVSVTSGPMPREGTP